METIKDEIEFIDVEEYTRTNRVIPGGKKYRIKIDGQLYIVPQHLTGAEILQIAGKTPIKRFQLNQRMKGGTVRRIDYTETVDFTTPGVEKFMTIPLDQTEG